MEGKAANEHLTDALRHTATPWRFTPASGCLKFGQPSRPSRATQSTAQGLRTGGSQGNELLAQAVAAYRCALEEYTPEGFLAYHVRVEANLAKARTCLKRRRPLSERDFPSLAYISSSRTRVLKHHPGASAGHAPETRPSHSL